MTESTTDQPHRSRELPVTLPPGRFDTRMRMDRVLVVLPNWYGETLFATPFLRALRRHRPNAFIATLGWPQCGEVLLHNPQLNAALTFDERGVHRGPIGCWRLVTRLRAHQFDTAFILRRSLSRTLLLVLAGIRTRVGTDNAKSGWLLTHPVAPAPMPCHKVRSYFPLLERVGFAGGPGACDYVVGETERQAARQMLQARGLLNGAPLVVLHPGANWTHKRWAPERFAALGDRLVAAGHAQIAITGSPDDVTLARRVAGLMRSPAVLLAGLTTLRQLGATLEHTHLVVSNDTGVLHIAAALGRPLVALYGPTSPQLTGPLADPARTIVLHHPDCCPQVPCYRPQHPSHPGMDAIGVEEVYAAAYTLLEAGQWKSETGRTRDGHA